MAYKEFLIKESFNKFKEQFSKFKLEIEKETKEYIKLKIYPDKNSSEIYLKGIIEIPKYGFRVTFTGNLYLPYLELNTEVEIIYRDDEQIWSTTLWVIE